MARAFAQFLENASQSGILEVLSNDQEFHASKAPNKADDLKVAKMGRNPESPFAVCNLHNIWFLKLQSDDFSVVVCRESLRPEEIKEGSRKGLIGSDGDSNDLILSDMLFGKRSPQVFMGGGSPPIINQVSQGSKPLTQQHDRLT